MNENDTLEEKVVAEELPERKPVHVPALVLGILSIVLGVLVAVVGDVLSIIGIILSVSKRKTHRTKAALICSIIGLVISIGNHIAAALMVAHQFIPAL